MPPPTETLRRFFGQDERLRRILDYDLLQAAAVRGDVQTVEVLLACGADLNSFGGGALVLAARHGQLEMVRFLLDSGATLVEPALYFAAITDHPDVVSLLLQRGADPTEADHRALKHARELGRARVVSVIERHMAHSDPAPYGPRL